jgi:hypothetical protein
VHQRRATHMLPSHCNVGYLRSHTDDKRKVGKVEEVPSARSHNLTRWAARRIRSFREFGDLLHRSWVRVAQYECKDTQRRGE